MPMIECYECGQKVSDYAKSCPKCGAVAKPGDYKIDFTPYRCKKCDRLIKSTVDACPGCGTSQANHNLMMSIVGVIATLIVFAFLAAWRS